MGSFLATFRIAASPLCRLVFSDFSSTSALHLVMGGSCSKNRRRGGPPPGGGGGYGQQISRRAGPSGLSGPGGLSGQGSALYNNYMGGLLGGEYETPDRVLTGQVTSLLSGGGGFGGGSNINYGLPSTCPEGVDQNTALLATAAAIAVGAGVLFRAITLQQAGRRRRRRSEGGEPLEDGLVDMVMKGIKKYR